MKYFIHTYGCQMNVHESEKVAGVLEDYGITQAQSEKEADVIVFNTCCIREGAETKIFSNIGNLKKLKKQKKHLIVCVLGCMTQQKASAENLKSKFPWIDIIIGTFNADQFEMYLKEVLEKKTKIFDLYEKEQEIKENAKFFRTSGKNAWVNITYGCNNFCTYCIVPYVRGRERSRKSENIINECKKLISEGYKYITLLGQNVNSYGANLEEKITFPMLCKKICALEGDFKLKFMTSHPKDFSDELIDVIASEPKMSKVVHLPCQSGDNDILHAMNRRYTREWYISRIQALRAKCPDVILTSDFIVGFPGESEEQFENTYSLVKEIGYNSIFAFIYSRRKGTIADTMQNQVDDDVKRQRVNKLLNLQHEITKQKDQALIGKTFTCLIEKCAVDDDNENKEDSEEDIKAITESGKTIFITKQNCKNEKEKEHDKTIEHTFSEDKFYNVIVTDVQNGKVYGKIVEG